MTTFGATIQLSSRRLAESAMSSSRSCDKAPDREQRQSRRRQSIPAQSAHGLHRRMNQLRQSKLRERLAAQLCREIASGRIAAGSPIPSEPELVGQYSVGETVVRETCRHSPGLALSECSTAPQAARGTAERAGAAASLARSAGVTPTRARSDDRRVPSARGCAYRVRACGRRHRLHASGPRPVRGGRPRRPQVVPTESPCRLRAADDRESLGLE
jgi:hypothetical protein